MFVGLQYIPIQVTCLHIAETFRLRAADKHQICREILSAFDTQDITDFNIPPSLLHELCAQKHFTFSRV